MKTSLQIIIRCILFFGILIPAYAQDSTNVRKKGVDIFITQSPKIIITLDGTTDNKCYGNNNGTINITPKGGFPPYKYFWSHGATTQDVADLAAGSYKVAVYDGYSCSDTMTIEIKQPDPLEAEVVDIKNIVCYGYNQGVIDIEVKGGVKPYTYSWSNGATSQDLEGVKSGEYSVLITDANNCQEIIVAKIEETPLIVRSFDDLSNIKCYGDETGKIDISIQGGTPPYTYLWSNGATTEDLDNLKAGSYEVTVTDAAGCTEVYAAKVEQPNELVLKLDEVRNVRCYGDEGGTINIAVDGGIPPYTYEWNNGFDKQDMTGVKAGKYSVLVTDANGCSNSLEAEITQPENLIIELVESKNVSYYSGSDGAVDISVSGGAAPYKFKWNNGATTEDISNLKAGDYNAKVTDATGCSKFIHVTINEPSPLTASIDKAVHLKCFGDENGEIAVSVFGGVQPYTLKWNTGDSVKHITNLKAGSYSVTITDGNNHKVKIDTSLVEPEEFIATVANTTNILCNGDKDGAIDVDVKGGVAPYKYYWNNGMITQDVIDVPAGLYSVKILDANRCVQNLEVEISQPEELLVRLQEVKNVLCFDDATGAINITVEGGSAPYKFKWSNESTTQNLTNLKAGNYKVTVEDNNGCVKEFSTRVSQPELLVIREEQAQNIDCFGNNTGFINLNISGGVKPYRYKWNNGDSTQNIRNLTAGDYNVLVTDANGCTSTYKKTLTSPEKLVAKVEGTVNNICAGESNGEIDISVVGGQQPYKYRWSTGATSQDLSNIKSGNYKVEIIDANGCIDSLSAVITEPTELTIKVESTNILCFGDKTGAINITVEGGVAPYKYSWNNGAVTQDITNIGAGEYAVVVTDANSCTSIAEVTITEPSRFNAILESETHISCYGQSTGAIVIRVSGGVEPYTYNWSNGVTTQNNINVPAGTYDLTVSDANGCIEKISSTISQPTEVKQSITKVTNLTCYGDNGGAIDISVIGGVGPYEYLWSNGATTQDLVNVPAGKYSVQIKEGNGCVNTLEATITQPENLVLALDTVKHIKCFGNTTGAVEISVKGGVPPYKYSWSNGATTQDISNLAAGNYSVTVTDAHGCIKSASTMVKQPNPFVASLVNVQNVLCNGDSTGSIAINITGGVQPYRFRWSNGATTQNLTKLPAGAYSLTVTDNMGCTQELETVITQPDRLKVNLVESANVSCSGGSNGFINIAVSGGRAPYQYQWNNGAVTQDLTNVTAGTYSVRVMDANGCADAKISVTITQPTQMNASISNVTHISSYGLKTGAISLSVSGGVSPYSYSWSNGATSKDISNLPAGNYSVFITDANNCEVTLSTIINQPPQLNAKITSIKDVQCSGNETGAINLEVSGGVKPYAFEWSNGDTTLNLTNVPAGDYALTITDANNHRKVITSKISEPTKLNVNVNHVEHVKIYGETTGEIDVSVTGGTAPYGYNWSSGQRMQDLSRLPAGKYDLIVTDAAGCTDNVSVTIEQPAQLITKIANVDHIDCSGDQNGSITLQVTGGVEPYQFRWSNGERTKDIEQVIAGVYSVQITDANGSTQTLKATITERPPLKAEITTITHNQCFSDAEGSISIYVFGGSGSYTYSWSNGDSTKNIANLPAGDYDVIIRDSLGCEQKLYTTIEEPEELVAEIDLINHISCFGEAEGKIELNVNGGTAPYRYRWSNGSDNMNLTRVVAGKYSVEVYDAMDCFVKLEGEITEPDQLTLKLDTVLHNLCKDDIKGLVDISVTGGVKPYEFRWSNGERTEDLIDVIADVYTVTVKDANGCTQRLTTEVTEPQLLSIVADSISNVECNGDETGFISVRVAGGVEPYQFAWNNGATGPFLQNVKAGTYETTVKDANGCIATLEATIQEPTGLISSISAVTDIQCYGDSTGAIYINVMSGVPPYKFEWSNGARTPDITDLTAGDYQLTITEGNGCITYLEASISQPEPFDYEIVNVEHVNCYGETDGSIDIEVIGGVPPYTYQWSNGATTQDISGVKADNYSVMILDANGCSLSPSVNIEQPKELALTIDSVRNVKCCGDQSGAIFITVTGGVAPYRYEWSNGATTQDIQNLALGKYTVTVTDAIGCVISTLEDKEMDIYEQVLTKGKFITTGIQFDVARASIRPESFSIVNKIATIMKEYPELTFRIEGHTDSDGSAESNLSLSKQRAASIKEALVKFGISANRLQTEGYGESQPIASNLTQEGKQQNRRVEFISLTGNLSGQFEGLE